MEQTPENKPADLGKGKGARRFFRSCALGCLLPLVIVVIAGWIALWIINHPKLNAAHATRVDVILRDDEKASTNYLGAITNVADIRKLLSVLANSSSAGDHKCGDVGWFVIRYDNGKTRRIEFLPGHHTENYEYRAGIGVRRMNRAEFLGTLQSVGIRTNDFPSGYEE